MSKRARQYIGLCLAILSYYIIHKGAHLMYALKLGVFKKIDFIGLGVQIDVFAEKMTENQLVFAAECFHSKWRVPTEAYLECMEAYLQGETEYGWYLCLDGNQIVGELQVVY